MSVDDVATLSTVSNLLLHLFTLHECKFAIHIQSENATNDNDYFSLLDFPLQVQDSSFDVAYESHIYGKACIISFDASALSQFQLPGKRKRPVKILLGKYYALGFPRLDYHPAVIESPPIISLLQTSGSTMIFTTACPEVEKSFNVAFFDSIDDKKLSKCIPHLEVSF